MTDNIVEFSKTLTIRYKSGELKKFRPYKFQQNVLRRIQNREYYVISKARQMHVTSTLLTFSLFKALQGGKDICYIGKSRSQIDHTQRQLHNMIYNSLLDKMLKNEKRGYAEFSNGSIIHFISSQIFHHPNGMQYSGYKHFDIIIVDEAAFMNDGENIQKFIKDNLNDDHHVIIASTPNTTYNWFDRIFMRALRGQNKFIPIQLDWRLHPELDSKWRDEQNNRMGSYEAIISFDGNVKEVSKYH